MLPKKNSPKEEKRTRVGRLLNSVKHFYGPNSTFVHSPIRDVLKVLYPEHEANIYMLDTYAGRRYVLSIPREIPDGMEEEEI